MEETIAWGVFFIILFGGIGIDYYSTGGFSNLF